MDFEHDLICRILCLVSLSTRDDTIAGTIHESLSSWSKSCTINSKERKACSVEKETHQSGLIKLYRGCSFRRHYYNDSCEAVQLNIKVNN